MTSYNASTLIFLACLSKVWFAGSFIVRLQYTNLFLVRPIVWSKELQIILNTCVEITHPSNSTCERHLCIERERAVMNNNLIKNTAHTPSIGSENTTPSSGEHDADEKRQRGVLHRPIPGVSFSVLQTAKRSPQHPPPHQQGPEVWRPGEQPLEHEDRRHAADVHGVQSLEGHLQQHLSLDTVCCVFREADCISLVQETFIKILLITIFSTCVCM